MRLNFIALLLTAHHLIPTAAFLTHGSIRNLTVLTDGYRERIEEGGDVSAEDGNGTGRIGGQQVVMQGRGDDEEEVEIAVAAALRLLCSDLLVELEKPLPTETSEPAPKCQNVIKEWHEFLGATVKFLHVVQERQMLWHWGGDSVVFDGVSWLQGLWASRNANKQQRSFIEQQMLLYDYKGSKSCFGERNEEVLHRDVEIVEYMNDLIDSFS